MLQPAPVLIHVHLRTVIGEINAGFNNCVLSSFRALIYICCLKIVVFAHDYMLLTEVQPFEMSLCFCYAVFCSVFANLGTVKVVVYLRPPAGSFLCMFWTALLAERTAFSGRLVSSAVGRRPLRGFKNLKRLTARVLHTC